MRKRAFQSPFEGRTFLITRELVEQCDIGPVLSVLSPAKHSMADLAKMCGSIRLRFEHTVHADDLFAKREERRFVRHLHQAWPWVGFFVRCQPVTLASDKSELIDAGILVGWALCNTNELSLLRRDPDRVSIEFNPQQFEGAVESIIAHAEHLCRNVGLSKSATRLRSRTLQSTVRSFFALGEQHNRGSNQ